MGAGWWRRVWAEHCRGGGCRGGGRGAAPLSAPPTHSAHPQAASRAAERPQPHPPSGAPPARRRVWAASAAPCRARGRRARPLPPACGLVRRPNNIVSDAHPRPRPDAIPQAPARPPLPARAMARALTGLALAACLAVVQVGGVGRVGGEKQARRCRWRAALDQRGAEPVALFRPRGAPRRARGLPKPPTPPPSPPSSRNLIPRLRRTTASRPPPAPASRPPARPPTRGL